MHNLYLLIKKIYSQWEFKFFPAYRLRKSGARVGKNIFFGDWVYVELENAKYLEIEDEVVLSAFSKIILHDSSLFNTANGEVKYGKVVLKKNCYLGANTLVLPNTEVGENTIIGAGSLLKGKYLANSVYAGVPAKYLYSLSEMKKRWTKPSQSD